MMAMTMFLLADNYAEAATIAIAGMLIVGCALTLISLFIAALPKVLGLIEKRWPEVDDGHGNRSHPESQVPDDGAVLAAIGFVLHTELQKQIDQEQSASKSK